MNLSLLHALASEPWYISETTHADLLSEALAAVASPGAEPDLAKLMGMAFPQRPPATGPACPGVPTLSAGLLGRQPCPHTPPHPREPTSGPPTPVEFAT